jgi:3-hydroxyisobutyrate dehydrogenase-like beta-hydroxyacid dehydrogenase
MVGGTDGDYARALPVLGAMGRSIVHVGALGQGQMVKLINNSLAAANAAAVAEALVLAAATGVDIDALHRVVGAGSGASAQLEAKAGAMRAHDYTTLFKAEHMLKDVRLCLEEARAAGVPFPTAAHAHDLLSATVGRGHGADDYAAIVEAVEASAGRRIAG